MEVFSQIDTMVAMIEKCSLVDNVVPSTLSINVNNG
jgi:hypothetical protein